jgi:hypothetical protein
MAMDTCENCRKKSKPESMHNYCTLCSRNLCDKCMLETLCDHGDQFRRTDALSSHIAFTGDSEDENI